MNAEIYKLVMTAVILLVIGSVMVAAEDAWHNWPDRTAAIFLLVAILSALALIGALLYNSGPLAS